MTVFNLEGAVRRRLVRAGWALVVLVSVGASGALAWSGPGHRLVGLVAWDQMDEESRTEAARILRKHERFSYDFWEAMPKEVKKGKKETQDRWIFMHATTWPDIARDLGSKYHHGKWHYINEPIYLDKGVKKALGFDDPAKLAKVVNLNKTPPSSPCKSAASKSCNDMNAMQALAFSIKKLNSNSTSDKDKAIYLSWVLHLVGDLHQPLHSAALFSKKVFRKGDKGGGRIKAGNPTLHQTWDRLFGTRAKALGKLTGWMNGLLKIKGAVSAGESAAKELSADTWLEESFELAGKRAYTGGVLEAVRKHEQEKKKGYNVKVKLTKKYRKDARAVAERRVVEGGYRLAGVVESLKL